MLKVVGIRFKQAGKIYYFDPMDFQINQGDFVIVETSRGIEFGEVVIGIREVEETTIISPLKKVIRIATEEDIIIERENKEREASAFTICVEKVREHELDMKMVDVEYTFDRNKVIFYFTADGRIDFRELVKDLAQIFKTRIELRQIGVRDEAKVVGGVGICGRTLCCSTFLGDFQPVSIKMAKEQSLSLNPTKISGVCGRLMCCLKYEQDVYEEINRRLPKIGSIVLTPKGEGTVVSSSVLRETVVVKFIVNEESELHTFDLEDIKVVKAARDDKKEHEEKGLSFLED